MSVPHEKILLRWMNFQLKKGSFRRTVTNFSSDVKVCLLRLSEEDDCVFFGPAL